ncbi:hypothetical protein [Psychrobacillus vulpis]|uniref:DUF5666 domain-containing protein n=1 Tax=Psychrobacillus vulpis TaxID=2325572 RepID=A0A544TV46_9BACI|nr:hypothetical protein [Psychrobacillus vulpis]TQR21314.1 hypothetical protein FG384_03675 [Psychrobacillus vulpis]
MFKLSTYILTFIILLSSCFSLSLTANAATIVNGMFVDATYEEVVLSDRTTEKQLTKITIINDNGKTITLKIDKYTPLFINSTSTTIEAFKEGILVQATVDLGKVKELQGFADSPQNSSDAIGVHLTGTVNEIDRNGRFISINLKDKQSKRFYVNQHTQVFKDTKLVDLSAVFAGDRVKLNLSEHDNDTLSSIEVIVDGIQVENLYKGTIQKIDANQKKLLVKEEKVFQNWDWQSSSSNVMTSKQFTAKTPIYVGNKKIDPSQLHYYTNNEVYYVTIKQLGQEVIQKMIIKQSNERTLHERLNSVDTSSQNIRLSNTGNIPYNKGTIIIRNGRLVDASALSHSGNAYVITNGVSTHQYANVINITNDGFQSTNLSNHEIYFGQISNVGVNQILLTNANKLINNYWYSTPFTTLNISKDTFVTDDYNSSTKDFTNSTNQYAYFYVKDNHVVAARIISYGSPVQLVSIGRYDSISNNYIYLKDVNQWNNGNWTNTNQLQYVDVSLATFIKEGKVISINELNWNDRLYIIHDSYSNARIVLVD